MLGFEDPQPLAGATNNTLVLTDISADDMGAYFVRVNDDRAWTPVESRHVRVASTDCLDWPMWGYDATRRGLAPLTLEEAARFQGQLDSPIFTALAAQGRLLIVTENGSLYAFGPETRDPTEYDIPDEPPSAAAQAAARASGILQQSGVEAGYALVLGIDDGGLVEQLAVQSDLHIVGFTHDHAKLPLLRRRFDDAGLYGHRIHLLPAVPGEWNVPPYLWSLIVVEDPDAYGAAWGGTFEDEIVALLRPYGGKAVLAGRPMRSREGPLPGAGQWTHQYADAANSAVSWDDRVRLPLGPLWFGGPTHDTLLPRHASGPRPHVAGGRLIILGVDYVNARCVYTGRELWIRDFPGIGHAFTNLTLEERWGRGDSVYMTNIPGATYIGSPHVSLADGIYLRYMNQIHRLDPDTGETMAQFSLRQVGVNLGAPGMRRDDNGTVWVQHPRGSVPSPNLNIQVDLGPDGRWFRIHSSEVQGVDGKPWVAASGAEGVTGLTLPGLDGTDHTVVLHFIEPDPETTVGERVFSVQVGGQVVDASLDIVQETGGALRPLTRTLNNVSVAGNLTVDLQAQSGSKPPVLSGVEIRSPAHQVRFYLKDPDWRSGGGDLEQKIFEGLNAIEPAVEPPFGWNFEGWDGSFAQVQSDLDIHGLFEALRAKKGTPYWWLVRYNLATEGDPAAAFNDAELTVTDPERNIKAFQEHIAGTDPTDPQSRFLVGQIESDAAGPTLQWDGVAGREYRVYRLEDLREGIWAHVHTEQVHENRPVIYTDEEAGNLRERFYHVRVRIP